MMEWILRFFNVKFLTLLQIDELVLKKDALFKFFRASLRNTLNSLFEIPPALGKC